MLRVQLTVILTASAAALTVDDILLSQGACAHGFALDEYTVTLKPPEAGPHRRLQDLREYVNGWANKYTDQHANHSSRALTQDDFALLHIFVRATLGASVFAGRDALEVLASDYAVQGIVAECLEIADFAPLATPGEDPSNSKKVTDPDPTSGVERLASTEVSHLPRLASSITLN